MMPGGRFIYVSLARLAMQLRGKLTIDERRSIVGVGTSGSTFAGQLQIPPSVSVETKQFEREREQRTLDVTPLTIAPVLVDDIAVSGLTLSMARQKVLPEPTTAAVGMLYRSRWTRRRVGIDDLRAGIVYCREGGGNPPINAISSLQVFPDRLGELAERYFGDAADEFCDLIKETA